MKNLFYLIPIALLVLSGCKKEDAKITIVDVTVTDALNAKRGNFTVYQISSLKYNQFGPDDFFRDQQVVTEDNGVASFIIDDIDFAGGGQETYYFFCKYTLGTSTTVKTKTAGVTLLKGDQKTLSLQLN